MAGSRRVELAEDGLLDLHPLGHRLDDEVDVAELLVGGRAGDQAHHLGEAGVGLLLGQLLLLDQAGELALGDRARLLDRGIDELLVDVLDDDGDVGCGDRLGDLTAHGAAADDGGLRYEHWLAIPPVSGRPRLSAHRPRRRQPVQAPFANLVPEYKGIFEPPSLGSFGSYKGSETGNRPCPPDGRDAKRGTTER